MQSYHVQVDIAFPCDYVCTVAMEAASEEESGDKYRPPNWANVDSDHYYSTNAPHPDLVRACEDDDMEQIRQTVNIGTPTEPVIRPDLLEQVPEPYFHVPYGERIPMTIMVSQKYLLPPPSECCFASVTPKQFSPLKLCTTCNYFQQLLVVH